jgi:hypothetical protein
MKNNESSGLTEILRDLQALSSWLSQQRQTNTSKIVTAYVDIAINEAECGIMPQAYPWSRIAGIFVSGDPMPPTAMSQVANSDVRERWFSSLRQRYLQHCESQGANPLRFVENDKEKPITYGFEPDLQSDLNKVPFVTKNAVVRWNRTVVNGEEISTIGRIFYRNGRFEISGWRRGFIYIDPALQSIIFIILTMASWLSLIGIVTLKGHDLNTSIINFIIFGGLLAWFLFRYIHHKIRSLDLRTHRANPFLVKFREDIWVDRINGNLGRTKSDQRHDCSKVPYRELVRWSADCPICGAPLELKTESPVRPRELVGCCFESPDEHCFSFDRVTLEGRALRAHPMNIFNLDTNTGRNN